MQYPYSVFEGAIENLVWIPHESRDVHARPLDHRWLPLRVLAYLCDDFPDANFNVRYHHFAKCAAICGNFMEIGCRASRILNLHAVQNVLNAPSTSSSVAIPLRSASSIASNSCGVA